MMIRHLAASYLVPIRPSTVSQSRRLLFIASIGNPEPKYEGTKHNIGHRMLDQLVDIYWKDHLVKDGPYYRSTKYSNIVLFKSNDSLMNLQGKAVSKHYRQFQKDSQLVILHDELQVPVGKYQIRKPSTSPRGHNGLKSINQHLPNNYTKVAIGIGRPSDKRHVVDYVMSKFKDLELEELDFEVLPKCVKELEKLVEMDKEARKERVDKKVEVSV